MASATPNAIITPGVQPGTGLVEPVTVGGGALLPLSYTGIVTTTVTGTAAVIHGTAGDDTIELLATKAGEGSIAIGSAPLDIAQAKTLPASD